MSSPRDVHPTTSSPATAVRCGHDGTGCLARHVSRDISRDLYTEEPISRMTDGLSHLIRFSPFLLVAVNNSE